MTGMPIAEQHRIVHELVERYKFETKAVYYYMKDYGNIMFNVESFTDFRNNNAMEHAFLVRVYNKSVKGIVFLKSIQELQETCFQDLLNPTDNELTLFELQYGFKWPLQLGCEPIAHGLSPQPLTGETNETN